MTYALHLGINIIISGYESGRFPRETLKAWVDFNKKTDVDLYGGLKTLLLDRDDFRSSRSDKRVFLQERNVLAMFAKSFFVDRRAAATAALR